MRAFWTAFLAMWVACRAIPAYVSASDKQWSEIPHTFPQFIASEEELKSLGAYISPVRQIIQSSSTNNSRDYKRRHS